MEVKTFGDLATLELRRETPLTWLLNTPKGMYFGVEVPLVQEPFLFGVTV